MAKSKATRRSFIKKAGAVTAGISTAPFWIPSDSKAEIHVMKNRSYATANTPIHLGLIGCGIQGIYDTQTALRVPGVKLRAVCDLYKGRLERAKELWGNDLYLTRDYRELLARKDLDAVIIATPDHWHKTLTIAALKAGKAVYCEKPMVQEAEEGHQIIQAQKETGKVCQVGSQGMSSLGNEKAKSLYEAGAIGELVMLDMYNDRYSAEGAWQYPIPPDANPSSVDYDTFLGEAPKTAFDAKRFFRWRNYRDYGTGVAGDLFVHAFSSLHYIINSKGPVKALSTGGLRYWNDGRDVPDVTLTFYNYPKTESHAAFNASFRVNFIAGGGGGGGFRLIGTEGAMEIGQQSVRLYKTKLHQNPSGYSMVAYTEAVQEQIRSGFSASENREASLATGETVWEAPGDYKGGHYDHFYNFFEAVRGNKSVVQNPEFGLRAAGAALLANSSYYQGKAIDWDPDKMIQL